MDNLGLGKIIEGERNRDAIHVAVAPVTAGERLSPGQHIGIIGDVAGVTKEPIGIVDPFLPGPVFKGDRFWMFLYPYTITSLRHEWEHPAFTGKAKPPAICKEWLEAFAGESDIGLDELLRGAANYLDTGDHLIQGGRWEGVYADDEFWNNYESFTGRKVPSSDRGNFFSCSC